MIAATENDSVYALNRATGKTIWRANVGTPVPQSALNGCGNIFPLGITGTPVYDAGNGLVYAVAEVTGYQHVLVAVDAATGAVKLRRDLDSPTAANQPAYNQQRPALAIDDGRVYAAFGGLFGDCGAYQGSVVSAPLTGDGPLTRWLTPTSREGAVWGPGGPVVGPNGDLWISIGNGAAESGAYDGSDSVTELSPALQRLALLRAGHLGGGQRRRPRPRLHQPALAAGNTVFIVGKRGVGYLLDGGAPRRHRRPARRAEHLPRLRHGGGQRVHRVRAVPGRQPDRRRRSARRARRSRCCGAARSRSNGSPTVGGGAVWVTQYSDSGGTLYELSPATGQVEHQIAISQGLPHFSVAVAERRHRLRRHAGGRHRDQRRLQRAAPPRTQAGRGREGLKHATVRSDTDFELRYGR